METIPFSIASKKIKYIGVNLIKDVNDLYNKNYKPIQKEIEEDYRRWKDLPCSWIGRTNMMKIATLPKEIFMFKAISHQNPMTLIIEVKKSALKFIWKCKRLRIAKTIRSKKSNAGSITIPNFKLYYRAIITKTA
jgi:hypothetical protein